MRSKILIFLLWLVYGPVSAQYFTRPEGDSLIRALHSAGTDSQRMDLLMKVAEYHILSSYDHVSNFDTAMLLIQETENLNAKAKSKVADLHLLVVKSYFLRMSGKREDGKDTILKAINLLKDGPYYRLLGRAYYELSNYYDYDFKSNTISQRAAYIEMAIGAFEKASDINDLGNAYKVLADLHHLDNEYAKAFDELEKSLQYYESSHYKRMEGVYDLFGQLYYTKGDYKQALAYELLALKAANRNNDGGPQMCEIENNVGLTFYKLNDGEAALRHFKMSLAIAEKERDFETVFGMTAHVVEAYILLNKPDEALSFLKSIEKKYKIPESDKYETKGYMYKTYLSLYTILKQYDRARYYCDQLIMKTNVPGVDVFKLNGYYEEIIKYYSAMRDYPQALKYLNLNKELLERMHYDLGLSVNYNLWFSLDTAQGNYKSAVNHLIKANLIKDTILSVTKNREIEQLDVQYESEKKENDIRLRDQRIKALVETDLLRQANLEQQKRIRNATFFASILLLTLGGILFYQYMQKKKANNIITQRNQQLSDLLKEKEWLVREVHHRVKNNLQMVISLLNSQSIYLSDDAAVDAIQDSQRRMHAMSLIHQKLYQSENVGVIDMRAYINEFISYMRDIFETGSSIRFEQDVDPIKLDVSQAVPVGLILNEVITNSIKYAFVSDKNDVIKVSMHLTDHNRNLLLTISDNGIGLPADFNSKENNSLGMSLINGLVKQLEGRLTMLNQKGVKVIIEFPVVSDSTHIEIEKMLPT